MTADMAGLKGKLSKRIVIIVAALMLAGLIGAFLLKYGVSGKAPKSVGEKRTAATVAAQVGNDLPESVSMAKAEIAEADKRARENLAAEQRHAQALEAEKKAAHYPDDTLPFETGRITSAQVDAYRAAKDALAHAFERMNDDSGVRNRLPAGFDESASDPKPNTAGASGGAGSANDAKNPSAKDQPIDKAADSGAAQSQAASDAQNSAPDSAGSSSAETAVASGTATQSDNASAPVLAPTTPTPPASSSFSKSDQIENQLINSLVNRQSSAPKQDPNETWQAKQVKSATAAPQPPITPGKIPQGKVLQEGAVIPLVLLTALNNTLPGHVSARVTSNVYDSVTGDTLVIPAGSRLEGNYNQSTVFGQNRMMFGFHRIILPSGASIRIAAWNGNDALGRSGVAGVVDNHLLEQFGTGILLATLGYALQPSGVQNGVTVNTGGGVYSSLGNAAGQVTADTASGILGNYQNLKPELNVAAGTKCALIVLQDIALPDESHGGREAN